jgi:small subunit ribosomal protein S5
MEKRQRRNNPREGQEAREFDQKLVEVKRVTRVTGGGKRMRFRALIVIGDHKGKIGIGLRKGMDVTEAINKAVNAAKKSMIVVPIVNDTIPHQVNIKYKSSKLLMIPARPGTGVIAGGAVRSVLDMAGVKNVISKMIGSNNKTNNVRAAFEAFKMMRSKEEILKSRAK